MASGGRSRRDQQLHEQLLEKIENFVKLMRKVSWRWKNWSDFKGQHLIHFRWENWSKIETLSLNSQPRFRNYRMKSIVWMIQEILKMPNQYAVESTSVTSTLSWSWRNAKPFCGNAEPQQSAARYLEFAGYIGKRFCKSTRVFFVTLSRRIQSLDFQRNGRHTCTHKYGATRYMWWTSDSRHSLDSEISARTVSRKFIRPEGMKILQELSSRPTKTADLGTSLWQIPLTNNICLLDDKIQNRGMYLFTISNGSYAVSRRWKWLNQCMISHLRVL